MKQTRARIGKNDTVVQKLHKVSKQIYAAKCNGVNFATQRGYQLSDLYDSLATEAKEKGEWLTYCNESGSDPRHDYLDMWA